MNKKNCVTWLKQLNENKCMWPWLQGVRGDLESRKPERFMVGKNIWKLQQEGHGSVPLSY